MGKLHLIQNNQRLIEIFKEPFVISYHVISLFEHVLYSIFGDKQSCLSFVQKHGWDQFFYQGSGIKILGKMGLRDQNNGKKIGINGFRIYHVTTLPYRKENTLRNYLLERSSEGQIMTKCMSRVLPVANF